MAKLLPEKVSAVLFHPLHEAQGEFLTPFADISFFYHYIREGKGLSSDRAQKNDPANCRVVFSLVRFSY